MTLTHWVCVSVLLTISMMPATASEIIPLTKLAKEGTFVHPFANVCGRVRMYESVCMQMCMSVCTSWFWQCSPVRGLCKQQFVVQVLGYQLIGRHLVHSSAQQIPQSTDRGRWWTLAGPPHLTHKNWIYDSQITQRNTQTCTLICSVYVHHWVCSHLRRAQPLFLHIYYYYLFLPPKIGRASCRERV